MVKSRRYIIFSSILLVAGLIVLLIHSSVPKEYRELVDQYLHLCERNDPTAYDLCYFKPEYKEIKQALVDSKNVLISTKLLKYKKVNDNLYAFLVRYELINYYEESYSFVATIQGKRYIILNKWNIPDDLMVGYDKDDLNTYLPSDNKDILN